MLFLPQLCPSFLALHGQDAGSSSGGFSQPSRLVPAISGTQTWPSCGARTRQHLIGRDVMASDGWGAASPKDFLSAPTPCGLSLKHPRNSPFLWQLLRHCPAKGAWVCETKQKYSFTHSRGGSKTMNHVYVLLLSRSTPFPKPTCRDKAFKGRAGISPLAEPSLCEHCSLPVPEVLRVSRARGNRVASQGLQDVLRREGEHKGWSSGLD